MRLVSLIDGVINRFDRALWLTPPFDLTWATPMVGVLVVETRMRNDLRVVSEMRGDLRVASSIRNDLEITSEMRGGGDELRR